jgi:hypothetical protein
VRDAGREVGGAAPDQPAGRARPRPVHRQCCAVRRARTRTPQAAGDERPADTATHSKQNDTKGRPTQQPTANRTTQKAGRPRSGWWGGLSRYLAGWRAEETIGRIRCCSRGRSPKRAGCSPCTSPRAELGPARATAWGPSRRRCHRSRCTASGTVGRGWAGCERRGARPPARQARACLGTPT